MTSHQLFLVQKVGPFSVPLRLLHTSPSNFTPGPEILTDGSILDRQWHLNILYGYGEHGSPYWASRYATAFARMEAIGLCFVGPQAPAGRRADPWPDELPAESANVPTYHTSHQTPATATRQLDLVFASTRLAERVRVRALNEPDDWGPSDHCRIEIDVQ